jgi:hypothetical protein
MKTYCKYFNTEDEAQEWMTMKNRTSVNDIYCMVPGPADNFAVVDHLTAIELGLGYKINYR